MRHSIWGWGGGGAAAVVVEEEEEEGGLAGEAVVSG